MPQIKGDSTGTYSAADAIADYQSLVHAFQNYLQRRGVTKRAFSCGGKEAFAGFSPELQQKCVRDLKGYLEICQEAESIGIDALRDARNVLKFITFKLRLSIPDDFHQVLENDDIVEIFDYEGTQLYRNLSFFNISDYTIDDFFGRTWDYLYERSSLITKKIFLRVEETSRDGKCIPFAVPVHYMRERATENRKLVRVNLKYLAPLMRNGSAVAWVASSTASEVDHQADLGSESLQFL